MWGEKEEENNKDDDNQNNYNNTYTYHIHILKIHVQNFARLPKYLLMSTATERVDDIMDSTVTIVMEDTTGGLFCALIHKHHQIRLRKAVVIVFLRGEKRGWQKGK